MAINYIKCFVQKKLVQSKRIGKGLIAEPTASVGLRSNFNLFFRTWLCNSKTSTLYMDIEFTRMNRRKCLSLSAEMTAESFIMFQKLKHAAESFSILMC